MKLQMNQYFATCDISCRVCSVGLVGATVGILAAATIALADSYEIDWSTTDGGGAMFSTGGGLEMGSTLGQPDANLTTLTGGDYELLGGFWPIAVPSVFLGDMNCDGLVDNRDIAPFVLALVDPVEYQTTYPACGINQGDMDNDGTMNGLDMQKFVDLLLAP